MNFCARKFCKMRYGILLPMHCERQDCAFRIREETDEARLTDQEKIWGLRNECNHAKRYFRLIVEDSTDCFACDLAERFFAEFGKEEYIK